MGLSQVPESRTVTCIFLFSLFRVLMTSGLRKKPATRSGGGRQWSMRGKVPAQRNFVSFINVGTQIASNHPLRVIKRMLDGVLRAMSRQFAVPKEDEQAPFGAPNIRRDSHQFIDELGKDHLA